LGWETREEPVQFDTENCHSIDGVPVTGYTIDPPAGLLAVGENATLTIPGGGKGFGVKVRVLVVSVDGWGYEMSFYPDRRWYDYYPNGEVK
jgi:hypothetical protein